MRCAGWTWMWRAASLWRLWGRRARASRRCSISWAGLTPPTAGTVVIDGKDLGGMANQQRTDLRKTTVGFVFQKYNLLPTLSAEDNIKIVEYIGGRSTDVHAGV